MKKIIGWTKRVDKKNEFRFDSNISAVSILAVKHQVSPSRSFWSSGVYDTFYHRRDKAFPDSKTKTEALKHAMEFMRAHPNGLRTW